ncbi:tetratricopeptide repeat-containing sensor histidine kinase [Emticicia agri]|uniref:histidine kinase n=1 Tax=Emticicia agri TaxID=2492393 RepID=A0A4Q5M131_9BACT|nr:tetratricopeptide repeat protein [Emticicia agri]RYU95888.1 tetratricopeptide repeat protein [Emticicia agri]
MKKKLLLFILFPLIGYCQLFQEETEIRKYYNQPASLANLNQVSFLLNDLSLYDSSFHISRRCIALARETRNYQELGLAQFNIGLLYQRTSKYYQAVEYYEAAIRSFQRAKDARHEIEAYSYLGMCYRGQDMSDKNIEFQRRAIQLSYQYKNYQFLGMCHSALGLGFLKVSEIDSAKKHFNLALKFAREYADTMTVGGSLKNLGIILLAENEDKKGLTLLKQSIEVFGNSSWMKISNNQAFSYMALADYYHKYKDYQASIDYAQKAFAITQKSDWIEESEAASAKLYENFSAIGNQAKALYYLELNQIYNKQLTQQRLRVQQEALNSRLQYELQQNKIKLLNNESEKQELQRNSLIIILLVVSVGSFVIFSLYRTNRKQKKEIEEINLGLEQKVAARTTELQKAYNEIKDATMIGQTIERKRVAADLHDNLGSLLSALTFSLEAVDTTHSSPGERKILNTIKEQVNQAHEEVRLFSHNLQPTELEKEGLYNALEILAAKINTLNKIKLELDLKQLTPQAKNIEFNLYSICLEGINNILKHAQATYASISFKNTNGQLTMSIADNGKGIQANKITGIGLNNIKSRVEQIGAHFSIKSDEKGTVLNVTLT